MAIAEIQDVIHTKPSRLYWNIPIHANCPPPQKTRETADERQSLLPSAFRIKARWVSGTGIHSADRHFSPLPIPDGYTSRSLHPLPARTGNRWYFQSALPGVLIQELYPHQPSAQSYWQWRTKSANWHFETSSLPLACNLKYSVPRWTSHRYASNGSAGNT